VSEKHTEISTHNLLTHSPHFTSLQSLTIHIPSTHPSFFSSLPGQVQFDHRVLGLSTAASIALLWRVATRTPNLHPLLYRSAHLLGGMALAQASLGIATLLLYVPVPLAATHQAGSITLLSLSWLFLHYLGRPVPSAATMARG